MLMYLASSSHPDIQYAIHKCEWFTNNPCASHEQANLQICWYLWGTCDRGFIDKPSFILSLDCYIYVDFAGLWNVEHCSDPGCVHSHTGYVLTLGGYPLIWVFKLQTEISLSTTKVICQPSTNTLEATCLWMHHQTMDTLSDAKPPQDGCHQIPHPITYFCMGMSHQIMWILQQWQ